MAALGVIVVSKSSDNAECPGKIRVVLVDLANYLGTKVHSQSRVGTVLERAMDVFDHVPLDCVGGFLDVRMHFRRPHVQGVCEESISQRFDVCKNRSDLPA